MASVWSSLGRGQTRWRGSSRLRQGRTSITLEKPPQNAGGVAVSGDGEVIALATRSDRVVFYASQTGQKGQTTKVGNNGELCGLNFAPGSQALLHSSWSGLTAIDISQQPVVRPIRTSAAWPNNTMYHGATFNPSGDRFAFVWSDHTQGTNVSLCDWPSGAETARLPCSQYHHSYDGRILFTPNGRSLLFNVPDGSVALWDLSGETLAGSSTTFIAQAAVGPGIGNAGDLYSGCLGFSPDESLLAYGQLGMLGLWAWPSGKCLGKWTLPGQDATAYQAGFSLSGREVVVSRHGARGILIYRIADLLKPY